MTEVIKTVNASLDLNGGQVKNFSPEKLSSEPTGFPGREYYNTTTGKLGIYNGATGQWEYMGTGTGAVESVNSQTGVVVLDADDISDTSTTKKFTTASDITKLAGIEAGADVTDATNVANAGATMKSDTSLAGNGYFLDEDNMASNSAVKVPSQQSVKAYADTKVEANLAITPATKAKVTYDAKGLVTGGEDLSSSDVPNLDASKITSGTFDIARLPAGAVSKLAIVADQTARFALTTADVQNGDSVLQEDTQVMYYVVDDQNLDSSTGYKVYEAETGWSLISNKPQNIIDLAALSLTEDSIIQVKNGAFAVRTLAQLLTDLSLDTSDIAESTDKNYVSDAESTFLGEATPLGVPYAQNFLSSDFVDGVLTIAAATHGLGATADLEASVRNGLSEDLTDSVLIQYASNGNVTVSVTTGLEFNGRIIIKRLA